ncbi:MAG: histidine kinase [Jaaginema sp. PMC 1079.18]|nr:histidine kinase [Jaaginema sp. PMC 1080.18]MEC4850789.1 histidine kinase [Jaaginema sp. PMC 1079.18]MEC4865947.1 histidine kinase [Jaaginema sp. PMC 1078.18]
MLISNGKSVKPDPNSDSQICLKLLLFVEERSRFLDDIESIEQYLHHQQSDYAVSLETIEVAEQPYLLEHFRLVATPSLVKIFPEPRTTLSGSNLIAQLENCWITWQHELQQAQQEQQRHGYSTMIGDSSAESIRLSDEVFQLTKENEDLQEQLKFKDQVLAMLAHDLRSPLTAASIALETLEMAQNQPETQRNQELIEQVYKQARSQLRTMNRMIADILQAAKGNNSQLQLQCHPIAIQPLCRAVLVECQERLADKSLHLKQDIPQDVPEVFADEELIRQVLVNLLDNAIKYTPAHGTISLSLLHRTAQKVQVTIEDDGPGIPPEKRDRIFEHHFRLRRDRDQEGFGLGLDLCRRVISAHYGQLWVDSVVNEGSAFHFTLPVYR